MFHAFKQLETAGYHIDMASPYFSVYCGHESLVESEKYMKFSSELFEEDMLLFADLTESLDVYKRQVEVDAHGMKIRINENTSSSLIQKVLGAVVHVE